MNEWMNEKFIIFNRTTIVNENILVYSLTMLKYQCTISSMDYEHIVKGAQDIKLLDCGLLINVTCITDTVNGLQMQNK